MVSALEIEQGEGFRRKEWVRRPKESRLYSVISGNLETFLARQREQDRDIPGFVEREFREFLNCGVLARGFIRVHCGSCGMDRLVGHSCKKRGFCNSCGGHRITDTAAHLTDRVFPRGAAFTLRHFPGEMPVMFREYAGEVTQVRKSACEGNICQRQCRI